MLSHICLLNAFMMIPRVVFLVVVYTCILFLVTYWVFVVVVVFSTVVIYFFPAAIYDLLWPGNTRVP